MITLIHPSRNRPEMAYNQLQNWLKKSSGGIVIQHILSIDLDEPQADKYKELFTASLIVQNNPSEGYVVGATNEGAKFAKGGILIYLSDDFDCPQDWDIEVTNRLAGRRLTALHVNDDYSNFRNLFTIPIITRDLYDKWGFFWHPDFKSMFCDNFMWEQVKREGYILKAKDLVFRHDHHDLKRAEKDETYIRSGAQYNAGRTVFNTLCKRLKWNCRY
jgi:hypothetical protein